VPAAAVIPAPIAYIKVVAVKKLVVGILLRLTGLPCGCASVSALASAWTMLLHLTGWRGIQDLYFEEIRVLHAGMGLEYTSME
jgi:hypothetical protein